MSRLEASEGRTGRYRCKLLAYLKRIGLRNRTRYVRNGYGSNHANCQSAGHYVKAESERPNGVGGRDERDNSANGRNHNLKYWNNGQRTGSKSLVRFTLI